MKIILQDGVKDCGVCCLLSIVRFYGGDVSKEYLREITNTTKNGVNAYNLIEGAKKLGFTAEGVSGDMTNLNKNNLPCIAHLIVSKGYKHFVVIYKIDVSTKKIFIMDPAIGKKVMPFSEFKLYSTNNFILLKPIKKLPMLCKKKVFRKIILKYISDNKSKFIILLILLILYFVFNILSSFHLKYLIKFSIDYSTDINLFIICFIVLVLYFFKLCCEFLKNILLFKFCSVLDEKLTIMTFKQILLLPYLFFKNRTTGEVITRLKDLTIVKNFFVRFFSVSITDVISLVLFFIVLFNINKQLSIIILLFSLILMFFMVFRNIKKKKLYHAVCRSEEQINSYMIESLSNVDTVKGGHIEKRLSDKFLYMYKNLLEKNYIFLVFISVSKFIKDNIKDIMLLLVYGLGVFLVLEKSISLSNLLMYQVFFMYFLNSINSIVDVIDEYSNYKISINRIEDLYTISNEKFDGSYYYYNYKLDGKIEFSNLFYKYGSKMILSSVNLIINKGDKILLMGDSGSGKSSLMKILMRYLEVPYGMCSIDGIDINHYHLENIIKNISYISSSEYLFNDSLYNNLTLGRDVDDEVLNNICKITRVEEIIVSRDESYDLKVEENGINFSNGERQRIILGRYLLRNSNIYIFDEAFGQIDVVKEREILIDMFKYLKDKIVIVISHRKSNVDMFDRILKLENGKVHEEKI